ncbi:MAG: hypothetical protein ACREV7_17480 [Steroidobacteraceae bacterium]
MPISRDLGFVVEQSAPERNSGATPPAGGYFVAKRGGHGVRLDPIAHGALFAGPLTASRPGVSVPITASLRFVIQQPIPRSGREHFASALGYFVVRHNGQSLRLNPIGSRRLLRQPL